MFDCIWVDLVERRETSRTHNYQRKNNICIHWGSNPNTFAPKLDLFYIGQKIENSYSHICLCICYNVNKWQREVDCSLMLHFLEILTGIYEISNQICIFVLFHQLVLYLTVTKLCIARTNNDQCIVSLVKPAYVTCIY